MEDTAATGLAGPACNLTTIVDAADIVDIDDGDLKCRADFELDPDCRGAISGVRVFGSTVPTAEDPEEVALRSGCGTEMPPSRVEDLPTEVVGDEWSGGSGGP